jgi:hypothetical protein
MLRDYEMIKARHGTLCKEFAIITIASVVKISLQGYEMMKQKMHVSQS